MSRVWLVGLTESKVPEVPTVNDLLAHIARVSNPNNQNNTVTAPKLLKYLVKNRHWSPFEMAHMVVGVDTTRDIARQMLRHRSFAFQEFSQRYANAEDLGFETREARLQDVKNRQASLETDDRELHKVWKAMQMDSLRTAKRAYTWALTNGIAKEQARAVLPEGMTHSRLYMAGSIRSWIHFCEVRCDIATQKEHREVADQCRAILMDQFPALGEVLNYENLSKQLQSTGSNT
jgi:thymidylate synthase (FAD)